jgi:hypothetical protein
MNFKGKGEDFEKPSVGPVAAICYRVIDLGTQEGDYKGTKTKYRKILVSWEINEKMSDGRPFSISKRYTVSLAETSQLRKDLEAWRGKAFTEDEMNMFTEKNIVGKPCLLNLTASEDGKYINVKGISGVPKGMEIPAQVNPSLSFSLEEGEFSQAVFDTLTDKTKATIMLSPEWAKLKGSPTQDHGESGYHHEQEVEVPF